MWKNPLPLELVPSEDSLSFKFLKQGQTPLPLAPHPGAFGVTRKHHVHEGVDLYCDEGTPVTAVEDGVVVAIIAFTGTKAGSDWWQDTDAVLIEGASGVVAYGEIESGLKPGQKIGAGELVGHVKTVLQKDKGRPMSMLHLELYEQNTRDVVEWKVGAEKPAPLRDPTPFLKNAL